MNFRKILLATIALTLVGGAVFGMTAYSSRLTVSSKEQMKSSVTIIKTTTTSAVETATTTVTSQTETITTPQTTAVTTTTEATTTTTAPKPVFKVENVQVTPASVSSLKVTWNAEEGRDYSISWQTEAPYSENIQVIFKENGTAYLTGLRENSEYIVCVEPILAEDEEADVIKGEAVGHTPSVEVIQDFEREEGWTSCFAGERASGLTAIPSSEAIYGSEVDKITDTGIRRFENGDYACAMGTHYGYCGDRFLVELDNGIQFTCRICDSKGAADVQDEWGYGLYHWFGKKGNGKCIIEFIFDDDNLPSCVSYSGSWGYYDWNGLNLCSDIKSIQKLATW